MINPKIIFIILISSPLIVLADPEWISVQPSTKQVTITGFTRARSTIKLASEIGGKVKQVTADIGETIPGNGVFACIDDNLVNIDIKSAQNDMTRNQVEVEYFKKQVGRHQQLVTKQSAALTLLDDLERQLAVSQRELQSNSLQKQRLEETKRRHCINAPAGWSVVERNIEPGQWVDVGESVGQVGDFSKLLIPLALTQSELLSLKNNIENIKLTLPDYRMQVQPKIERISPAFDEQSRKILVDLVIEEKLPESRGGIRVDLVLDLPEERNVFLVPMKALDQRFEQVWIHKKDGTKIRAEVIANHGQEWVKIASPEIKVGDELRVVKP